MRKNREEILKENNYDLVIIGGGPAGITAGIYAARQRLHTLLIAKELGGQITRKAVAIENYPGFTRISGQELIKKFLKHLEIFIYSPSQSSKNELKKKTVRLEQDSVTRVKKEKGRFSILTERRKKYTCKAVVVASGAAPRPLGIPGEKKFIGRGVSYCTACDAPFFSNKTVVIVGGGNAGFEAALALSKWAKKIYILEYSAEVAADKINQERARKTGKVQVITNAVLKKIKGRQFVDSIVYQDRKTKKETTLSLQGVFVEIGSQPATFFVKGLVEFNERNEIVVNPYTYETKTPGMFAAGDVNNLPYKQIVIAAGEGARAALSAYYYLRQLE